MGGGGADCSARVNNAAPVREMSRGSGDTANGGAARAQRHDAAPDTNMYCE